MSHSAEFLLVNLDQFLPVSNRDLFLKWLKEKYIKALEAIECGFGSALIINQGEFAITAEDLFQKIDVKRGVVNQESAQFFVRLVSSGALPSSLLMEGQMVDPKFYYYAYPEELMFGTGINHSK